MAEYLRPPIVAAKPLVPPRKRTRIKASHLNPHIALNFIDFDCWNGIWGVSCAIFSLESRAMKFIFWSNSIKCNAQTRYQHFQSVLTTGDSTGIVPNPGRFSLHGQFRGEMYKYWGMSRIWTMILFDDVVLGDSRPPLDFPFRRRRTVLRLSSWGYASTLF